MRLGIISDLHFDLHPLGKLMPELLAEEAASRRIDTLLIAGDFAGYSGDTDWFVTELEKELEKKGIGLYFCLGNHDVWNRDEPGLTMNEAFDRMKSHEGFLQNALVPLTEKTVLVAGLGWWDFSLAERGKFTLEELMRGSYMGHDWNSRKWTIIDAPDDIALAHRWNEELLGLIRSASDKDVVLMTHMISHPRFLVGKDHPKYELFSYFNGLLGSEELNGIAKEPNVKIAISGHVHFRDSVTENGTYYTCPNLGNPWEFMYKTPEELLTPEIREAKRNAAADAHPAALNEMFRGQSETPEILRFHLHDAMDVVEIR